ncbi:hypothetical protein [Paraburkholderia silvatlantica]|uniref:Secreted protein n=1 Tax=Paraburkholderia silvatlantica TaxID=321895 RepID=A0ABR6FFX0_9BURK|nr:hypothetical protein [Paraburkholderia silvatlantica]MBB2926301.1 hypothetical protein [Paraburkholderia silvatlantica]PVY26852.1 hypothetical protein C7411_122126 [Paraburkholderia silvatlantica]PXW33139.1 hypothetical protein C7413_121126 [Paraburkholderia silvatlantica]TDQ75131.1 hypothetical protein C7412_14318 [Paraburkholderia silvatlantica]
MFGKMLGMLEHLAALLAPVLVSGHGIPLTMFAMRPAHMVCVEPLAQAPSRVIAPVATGQGHGNDNENHKANPKTDH